MNLHYLQTNFSDLQIINFNIKPGISQVDVNAVMYRMDMEQSWNVPLPSGSILEA